MDRRIFPNLPVEDVKRATDFYLGLGFTKNEEFSDEKATAVVISDSIVVMLLERGFYESFLPAGDTAHLRSSGKEVLNALTCESAGEVDRLLAACAAGGGAIYSPAKEHMPGMYSGSATDPDGHVWEFMHLPASAADQDGTVYEVSSDATVQEQEPGQ